MFRLVMCSTHGLTKIGALTRKSGISSPNKAFQLDYHEIVMAVRSSYLTFNVFEHPIYAISNMAIFELQ